jgi:hypothetical protein
MVTPSRSPSAHEVSDDPTPPAVGHVIGGPREGGDVEHDLHRRDDEQASGEQHDARTEAGDGRADGHPGQAAHHRHPPRHVVDQAPDQRGGEAGGLGDRDRHAEVGEIDVEAPCDRRQERWREAVQGVRRQLRRGERHQGPAHLGRVRVIDRQPEHRAVTLPIEVASSGRVRRPSIDQATMG